MPYQAGFSIGSDPWSTWWWFELLVDSYFVVDIGLNFRTPVTNKNGIVLTDSKAMAMNYLRGWFVIDLLACASLLQYIYLIRDDANDSSERPSPARATKALRMMRLAKLLRIARVKRLMKRVGDRVMHILAPMSNIFVLLMGTAFAMHLSSCFWYVCHQRPQCTDLLPCFLTE